MAEKKEKQYVSDNAQLMAEWHWEKNTEYSPDEILTGSGKKVWWMCSKGHEWQASINHRSHGRRCPFCTSQKVLAGYNDLLTINPSLAADWNDDKNGELKPENFTVKSGKRVWWKCNQGHEWQTSISDRSRGYGCPYCAGQKVLKGYNDLQTANPTLAAEWNNDKNGELKPENFTMKSGKKVWWACAKRHEWQATIDSRARGNGCPFCSGQRLIHGTNDLQTVNSTLVSEWNYDKNGDLTPDNIMANSDISVWWKCSKGHEWQAKIGNRNRGNGCPYCSGRQAIKGENDLQTVNPSLAKEWSLEKNNGLTPAVIMPNSGKIVWWKCNKGHEWRATIAHRNNGNGCPICNSERKTSFPEYAFVYYLKKYGLDVVHSFRENGYELDVYIPSKKTAIEFDGYLWHKNRAEKDLAKNKRCQNDGIKLYRIRAGLASLNDSSIDFVIQKDQKDFPQILERILSEIIGSHVDVDITRDTIDIDNLREYTEKANSFLFSNPKLATEWNNKKNGKLMPDNFTVGSHKKVWWICSKGHEWQATIASRNSGCGCPYCSGYKILSGYNDLAAKRPDIVIDWDMNKSQSVDPNQVGCANSNKAWWKCHTCGYEWEMTIAARTRGSGCPQCSRKKNISTK